LPHGWFGPTHHRTQFYPCHTVTWITSWILQFWLPHYVTTVTVTHTTRVHYWISDSSTFTHTVTGRLDYHHHSSPGWDIHTHYTHLPGRFHTGWCATFTVVTVHWANTPPHTHHTTRSYPHAVHCGLRLPTLWFTGSPRLPRHHHGSRRLHTVLDSLQLHGSWDRTLHTWLHTWDSTRLHHVLHFTVGWVGPRFTQVLPPPHTTVHTNTRSPTYHYSSTDSTDSRTGSHYTWTFHRSLQFTLGLHTVYARLPRYHTWTSGFGWSPARKGCSDGMAYTRRDAGKTAARAFAISVIVAHCAACGAVYAARTQHFSPPTFFL